MVAHGFDQSTQETEVQSQPHLHSEFKDDQIYIDPVSKNTQAVVAYAFNFSTWEVEADGFLRPVWSTE